MALVQPAKISPVHFAPFAIILFLWVFYGYFELSWGMANKIAGLAGVALTAITFLLGPLTKFWPKIFAKYMGFRKYLGLSAFALIIIHTIISILLFQLTFEKVVESPKALGFYAASGAFLIFLAMVLSSSAKACRLLGYKAWKGVQVAGYISLLLSLVHFFILESKPDVGFVVRPLGYAVFALGAIALIAKAASMLWHREKTAYEQHVEHEAAHEHAVCGQESIIREAEKAQPPPSSGLSGPGQ
jgi:DMSO/TMAO reductase YedYZ heme-binding membrane subunit